MKGAMAATTTAWRADLDALAFRFAGHDGWCLVHRQAFRALIGREAGTEDCLAFFEAQASAFAAAAAAKVARAGLAADANLHLTSRDVKRARRRDEAGNGGRDP